MYSTESLLLILSKLGTCSNKILQTTLNKQPITFHGRTLLKERLTVLMESERRPCHCSISLSATILKLSSLTLMMTNTLTRTVEQTTSKLRSFCPETSKDSITIPIYHSTEMQTELYFSNTLPI